MLAFSAFSGGRLEVRARAKVNLGLEVLGRRADGYHELRSVMWAIELADRVTLEGSGGGITLECTAPDVPRTADNLAWRAAELVRRETGAGTGLRVRIEKRIPVAAGLGGGSTDAAAVLAGLGSLRKRRLGPRRLGAMAVSLGMDVPFFLGRSPALARGRGEELQPLGARGDLSLVLANPGFPLSTRDVYARLEPADYGDGRRVDALVTALRHGVAAVAATVTNGLECAAARLWPGLTEVKAALLEAGCLAALMSGSGPTVLGIAPSHRAALRIRDRLGTRPWRLWVTRTVTGPALTIRGRARAPGRSGARRPRTGTTWGVAKW
ncbi:MAG TPA: 4-(cytidine 5'-diphospho)-2-C-methyl-D-erythritol kinase [Methylomirabilota bacterium]